MRNTRESTGGAAGEGQMTQTIESQTARIPSGKCVPTLYHKLVKLEGSEYAR